MKTDKSKQYVTVFGVKLPRYRDCPQCGSKLSCEYRGYAYRSKCLKCQLVEDEEYMKTRPEGLGFGISHGMQEAVAIGVDKLTGQQVAINEKGQRVPVEKTRYDLKNDPHGWRATGKKVRETDSKGNPND